MMEKRRFQRFIIASLLIHMGVYALIVLVSQHQPVRKKTLAVKTITPEELARIKEAMKKKNIRQIVNTEIVNKTSDPDPKAEYLGQVNQTVKEQQKARVVDTFKKLSLSKGSADGTNSAQKPVKKSVSKKSGKKSPSNTNRKISLSELGRVGMKRLEKNMGAESTPRGMKGGKEFSQMSANNDHVPDIEKDGAQTLLNTREFVYFSYYNRIRKRLDMHWGPTLRKKMDQFFRAGRTIASDRKRITKVLVLLNKNGIIEQVKVIGDSGIQEVDTSAVEAFNKAGPFPHPPQGIVDPDGFIRIRWDFVLETA